MSRMQRVSLVLLLLVAVLYAFVDRDLPSAGSDAASSFGREAAQNAAGVPGPPSVSPGETKCPQGTTLVDGGSTRFCAVIGADGSAVRSGPSVRFHESARQRKAEAGEYSDGRKQGPWTEWYVSGARRSRLEFRDGQADGRWLEWYEDGTPKSEGYYAKGEEHGLWSFWLPEGQLDERGSMLDGDRDGNWTGWHPNGTERYRRRYHEGVLSAWEEWNPRGESINASDRDDGG